jgi:hypothetical protein
MKKLFPLLILFIVPLYSQAQEKPTAIKVDSYIEHRPDLDSLTAKIQQFLSRLAKEPKTTHAVIVFYDKFQLGGRCFENKLKPDLELENFVRKVVSIDSSVDMERIVYMPGLMYGRNEVEFWLVPAGAADPKPDYRDFDPPCCCLSLLVVGQSNAKADTKRLRFFVWLGNGEAIPEVTYKWTISNASIVSGQGTDQIEVEIKNRSASDVKAEVEIEGLDAACSCPTLASYTTKILP